MRVLLPLRKVPPHNQASNSSVSGQSASSSASELWWEEADEDGDARVAAENKEHDQEEDQSSLSQRGTNVNDPHSKSNGDSSIAAEPSVPSEITTRLTETSSSAAAEVDNTSSILPNCPEEEEHHKHQQQSHQQQNDHVLGLTVGETELVTSEARSNFGTSTPVTNEPQLGASSPNNLAPSTSNNRKRRPLDGCDSKPASKKKRPAFDKKPPPQELQKQPSNIQKKMVGGRRASPSWGYNDDDRRDSPSPLNHSPHENNPASAHGDRSFDAEDELSQTTDADLHFKVALKKRGLEIREQEGDGNCLFRAISLQVYGDPTMHGDVRKQCIDFMERDQEHFSQFVTGEPFVQYIQRKRQDGVHGNNPEIQAISELFNRPIEVYCPENGAAPLNIFHAEYKTDDAPIRLSYHDGNHYNAVVDPLVPTAGLGLGLPGLKPGLADKMQMAKAVTESDAVADQMALKKAIKESQDDELQRAIKESSLSVEHMYNNKAIALSDMDATYFELEQAALERSLQSYTNNEQGRKREASEGSGRRRRQGRISPCHSHGGQPGSSSIQPNRAVASLPVGTSFSGSRETIIPPAAAASVAAASSATPAAARRQDSPAPGTANEYPQVVQELVMNGFELSKVVRAYDLIGDRFDDLLSFLMSNGT